MMNFQILKLIGIFILVVIIHELGHYVAYRLFKRKPKIRFTWWGILIGENEYYSLTPFQAYIVNGLGIWTGWFVLILFELDFNFILLYIITCSVDITNIIGIISIEKKQRKMTLLQIAKIQLKRVEEALNRKKIY